MLEDKITLRESLMEDKITLRESLIEVIPDKCNQPLDKA